MGETLEWTAFTSTSTSSRVAHAFLGNCSLSAALIVLLTWLVLYVPFVVAYCLLPTRVVQRVLLSGLVPQRVIFEMSAVRGGKHVAAWSLFAHENEVLLEPHTRLRVIAVRISLWQPLRILLKGA